MSKIDSLELKSKLANNKMTIFYLVFNLFLLNFVQLTINDKYLTGSTKFDFFILKNFSIIPLIKQALFIFVVYFSLNDKKWSFNLLSIIALGNVVASLLFIKTSDFSLYNIILIAQFIFSILLMYSIHKKV